METKMIELRDRGTFIPAIAIAMDGPANSAEHYLLRRAGYGEDRCILFGNAHGSGAFQHDPFAWGDRTFAAAHQFIEANWKTTRSGDVIDVRFLLKETEYPATSERLAHGT